MGSKNGERNPQLLVVAPGPVNDAVVTQGAHSPPDRVGVHRRLPLQETRTNSIRLHDSSIQNLRSDVWAAFCRPFEVNGVAVASKTHTRLLQMPVTSSSRGDTIQVTKCSEPQESLKPKDCGDIHEEGAFRRESAVSDPLRKDSLRTDTTASKSSVQHVPSGSRRNMPNCITTSVKSSPPLCWHCKHTMEDRGVCSIPRYRCQFFPRCPGRCGTDRPQEAVFLQLRGPSLKDLCLSYPDMPATAVAFGANWLSARLKLCGLKDAVLDKARGIRPVPPGQRGGGGAWEVVLDVRECENVTRLLREHPTLDLVREVPLPTLRFVSRLLDGEAAREEGGSGFFATPGEVERRFALLPRRVMKALFDFQKEGVRFALRRQGRCFIGDEMGTGKTLQALAVMVCYKTEWPLLIVVPASLRLLWAEVVEKWVPFLRPADIHVIFREADRVSSRSECPPVVITSYEMLRNLEASMTAVAFHCVIFDESQKMATTRAHSALNRVTSAALRVASSAIRVLLLSGTPTMARPFEIYDQVRLLQADLLSTPQGSHDGASKWEFGRNYCTGVYWQTRSQRPPLAAAKYDGTRCDEELYWLLRNAVLIRRLKKDVMAELPSLVRTVVRVEEGKDGATIWSQQVDSTETEGRIECSCEGGASLKKIRAAYDQNCAAETCLMERMEDEQTELQITWGDSEHRDERKRFVGQSEYHQLGHLKLGGVKEWLADRLLGGWLDAGVVGYEEDAIVEADAPKFVIFAHHLDVLAVLHGFLHNIFVRHRACRRLAFHWSQVQIQGSTPPETRQDLVKRFKNDRYCRMALIGITAGGSGLDLAAASTAVFVEMPNSPHWLRQAEDRLHRRGQRRRVQIYYLVLPPGSAEDKVWQCMRRLLRENTAVINSREEAEELDVNRVEEFRAQASLPQDAPSQAAELLEGGLFPLLSKGEERENFWPGNCLSESPPEFVREASEPEGRKEHLRGESERQADRVHDPSFPDTCLLSETNAHSANISSPSSKPAVASVRKACNAVEDAAQTNAVNRTQEMSPPAVLASGVPVINHFLHGRFGGENYEWELEALAGLTQEDEDEEQTVQAADGEGQVLQQRSDGLPNDIKVNADFSSYERCSAKTGTTTEGNHTGNVAEDTVRCSYECADSPVHLSPSSQWCHPSPDKNTRTDKDITRATCALKGNVGCGQKPAVKLLYNLWFEVSKHTGWVHLHEHEDGSKPLGVHVDPLDYYHLTGLAQNALSSLPLLEEIRARAADEIILEDLPPFIQVAPGEKWQLLKFMTQFQKECARIRNQLYGYVLQPMEDGLQGWIRKHRTNRQGAGRQKASLPPRVLSSWDPDFGYRRHLTYEELFDPSRHSNVTRHVLVTSGRLFRRSFRQPLDPQTHDPLCFCCGTAYSLPGGTRTLQDLLCSAACLAYFACLSRGGLRREVGRRDRGICEICGLDTLGLLERVKHSSCLKSREMLVVEEVPKFKERPKLLARLVREPKEGHVWQADHIHMVAEGGGLCDTTNGRALCVLCHASVTAEQSRLGRGDKRRAGREKVKKERGAGMHVERGEWGTTTGQGDAEGGARGRVVQDYTGMKMRGRRDTEQACLNGRTDPMEGEDGDNRGEEDIRGEASGLKKCQQIAEDYERDENKRFKVKAEPIEDHQLIAMCP